MPAVYCGIRILLFGELQRKQVCNLVKCLECTSNAILEWIRDVVIFDKLTGEVLGR